MEVMEREGDEFLNILSPEDNDGNARRTVTAESNNQMLFGLRKVREDLERRCDAIEENQKEQLQALKEIQKKLDRHASNITESVVNEVVAVLDTVSDTPRTALLKSESSARKKATIRQHPNLGLLLEKERGVIPVLQWLCLITVVGFVQQQPNARGWISETTFQKLEGKLTPLSRASGLSILLFSVTAMDKNERYHTDIGKAWSFFLRSVMVSVLVYAKLKLFMKPATNAEENGEPEAARRAANAADNSVLGKALPSWLAAMGKRKKIARIVNEVEEKIEAVKGEAVRGEASSSTILADDETAPARKKRKRNVDQEEVENCASAVRQLRSRLTRMLSNGRTEARVQLYANILFIMDRILSYPSVAEAKEAGYEVVFHTAQNSAEETLPTPENLRQSIWNVPNARTMEIREKERQGPSVEVGAAEEWNAARLSELDSKFPSLTVTLRYKKAVIRNSRDSADGHPEFDDPNLTWPVEETVSLQSAAISVLMEAVKVDALEFLRASQLSLKAVHVVAIVLRGLLRKCLRQRLSQMEQNALGNVTNEEISKGSDAVTAMLGKARGGKPEPGRLEEQRQLKFEITWENYKEEKEKRRTQNISAGLGAVGQGAEQDRDINDEDNEDDDDDEGDNWLTKAGSGR